MDYLLFAALFFVIAGAFLYAFGGALSWQGWLALTIAAIAWPLAIFVIVMGVLITVIQEMPEKALTNYIKSIINERRNRQS